MTVNGCNQLVLWQLLQVVLGALQSPSNPEEQPGKFASGIILEILYLGI